MIIWLNGTFGVGKSTTAALLAERVATARIFDPEHVGEMLSANFTDHVFEDFQDLPPWRDLVPLALHGVYQFTGSHVIAPQTVLVQDYWIEIAAAMQRLGLEVTHVMLDCAEQLLRDRIDGDQVMGPSSWRHDHVPRYLEERRWMMAAADIVINSTAISASDVADQIIVELGF